MICDELKDSYELYSLGLLEGEEKNEMDAHVNRGCETCGKGLNQALALNTVLLSLVPEVRPPARLRRRIQASVGVERTGWFWTGALAAACMLIVALWFSVQERRREAELASARSVLMQVSTQRDRLQQALGFLEDPETRPVSFGRGQPVPPHGNVFVNPRSGILLIASNLPPLSAGKIYEMWIIPKGGAPRPAGLFQSNQSATAFHILSGPVDAAAMGAVAVTVEPESGSAAPTSTPVIMAPMAGL